MNEKSLAVFEGKQIRRHYDEDTETWYFSIVDILQVLIQQPDYQAARNYWKVLKNRLNKEGSESVTKCNRLKMEAADGKKYLTDVADTETLLRLIQSVPSPKAEPIKLWLAKVGYERMQDMADPARSLDRAREFWQQYGRSEKWIQQRMMGQETRNKPVLSVVEGLTDYWQEHEITKEKEYAILTNIIHQEWSGVSVKEHKSLKGLKSQNLRDHTPFCFFFYGDQPMSQIDIKAIASTEFNGKGKVAKSSQAIGPSVAHPYSPREREPR